MTMNYNPFDNQEFRQEMSKLLDEKLAPMAELKAKVDEHEKIIQRSKGGFIVINVLWGIVLAAVEWFMWTIHKR
jgi:hypothetical protein